MTAPADTTGLQAMRPLPRCMRAVTLPGLIAASLVCATANAAAEGKDEALMRRIDKLADELETVKAELARMRQERAATATADAPVPSAQPVPSAPPAPSMPPTAPASMAAATSPAPAPATAGTGAVATATPAMAEPTALGPGLAIGPNTVITGYGEVNYNRPLNDSKNTLADLRRVVIGVQHRFDDRTKVVTELEVEHAVSSADDPGEVAFEQAFVERRLGDRFAVLGGLFLVPSGLLNENHEPTAYYGVERNFVETAIIPTTWREGGLQLVGRFDNGLTAQGGIGTGFDLTKWDATSAEGAESPLGSIHQELALAKARDLSVFGALNWRGMPGLLVGGSVFTGGATHGQAVTGSRVTLWDLHGRYTPGRWDLSALYARGTISNTAELNTPLVGSATLIPASFDGWYAQAAYRVWSNADYSFSPFVRYEQFNTARSYASLGPGLTPDAGRTRKVATIGANFLIGSGVVLKADYQRFNDSDLNRVDLGLGWSF